MLENISFGTPQIGLKKDIIRNSVGIEREYFSKLSEENSESIKNSIQISNQKNKFLITRNNNLSNTIESIKNSTYLQGAGIAPLISQLAIATGEVYKQEYFEGDKDKNGNNITLERMIPTEYKSNYAYYPELYYQIQAEYGRVNPDNLFEGLSQNAGQVRQQSTQLSNASIEYKTQPILMYSNTIAYNDLQMQTMKKFMPDAWNQGIQGWLKDYVLAERYRNLVGNSDYGFNGLLNADSLIEEDETGQEAIALGLTVPLRELLKDEKTNFSILNNFANKIIQLKNGKLKGYNINGLIMKNAKLIVPVEDFILLKQIRAFETFGNQIAMQWLTLIESEGIEIFPCDVASASNPYNIKYLGGKNIYQLYDHSPNVIQRTIIQDISLYGGFHTANGVDFNGVFTSQFVLPFVINKNKIIRFKISNI